MGAEVSSLIPQAVTNHHSVSGEFTHPKDVPATNTDVHPKHGRMHMNTLKDRSWYLDSRKKTSFPNSRFSHVIDIMML